ncbi:MAG TPA: DUF2243 domain-containing protein [Ramlibacter sp.]|jgi:uncharacterized membrane protein|uniref:DUF2243 domain-containing protein n=1 Tax=Ramlibacter sp. TaxID=1917967 RepID=UPI002D6D35D1|nr:DUF2243 domain-containing protein [Ramlibacter sp.]HZY20247.1 DUF2243 domain-containing protein [Ramlibacter sp.]
MTSPASRHLPLAGVLLGVALGGFLDGILFHQVLQWHHLLSKVDRPGLQDLRVQVMADGAFHVLMYLIAVTGLVVFWRSRDAFARPGGERLLRGWLVIGFGGWHVADAVVFHWILGIHHIRMDSPQPVAWDVGFAVLGATVMVLGWRLLRSGGAAPGGGQRRAAALSVAVLAAGLLAAWPPPAESGDVLVLFGPGTRPASAFDAFSRVDGRVVWVDPTGSLWAVKLPEPRAGRALYGHGAWLVTGSVVAAGCLSWARVER